MPSSHYKKLRDKWVEKHRDLQFQFFDKHADIISDFINSTRQFAVGSVSAVMLLSTPIAGLLPTPIHASTAIEKKIDSSVFLVSDLANVLPKEIRPLDKNEEKNVEEILTRDFKFPVKAELEGKKLNRSYGYIGAEQHLMRYPGDNVNTHFVTQEDRLKYESSGLAPGLGGWGYWAANADKLTEKDILEERYYIAAPIFLAPGFHDNVGDFIKFFKYRKMLVVNPNNGKAMVVVVGDAGPAEFTGKHLGGSPEVMSYLERFDGAQKGPVLYLFIDDPEDKIPLGPINVK